MTASKFVRMSAVALLSTGLAFSATAQSVSPVPKAAPANEATAASDEAAPANVAPVTVKDLKLGSPVFGTDGIKVGEINRISSNADGTVSEIQVTTGGPAGLNAQAVSVPADKIATGGQSVKLSVTASEAKQLPVATDDRG